MSAPNLISVENVAARLSQADLIILFTSMADIATGQPEPLPAKLIPDSLFFDFEQVFCDTNSALPHTMPEATVFQREARKLGINSRSHIVVYDSKGLYSAARVWWMFKAMGHHHISILDGGLPAWLANNKPVTNRLKVPGKEGDFVVQTQAACFADADFILQNHSRLNVLDARAAGRFNGTSPEPRAGLRSGHIPGAVNLPFSLCIEDGRLKSPENLRPLFGDLHLRPEQPLVFSCGSGVTACILALAAAQLGYANLAVYDGSWSEWGSRSDLPLEK